jgi:hypothetical protein
MTSAALTDLQNRIASNTLTAAQQAALTTALAAIAPSFPAPSEAIVSVLEEPLAREWMAVLYTINGEGVGPGMQPTNQIVWHINALTGNNANNGLTSGTPIQSAAYLSSLWRGTVGGGRPQLLPSSGTTISVFLDSDLPASDPISVLLDVDLPAGTSLVIQGAAKAASRTGNMTTAPAFAQTSAGGQQKFTDAGVADFHPFVGPASLVVDSVTHGVGWLYNPLAGASATAICTRLYSPQSAGVTAIPTVADPTAGDAYTLSDVTNCTLGQDFRTRSFPSDGSSLIIAGSVFLYRLHYKDPSANASAVFADCPDVPFVLQECLFDTMSLAALTSTNVVLNNTLLLNSTGITVQTGALVEALAGGVQGGLTGNVLCTNGGGFLGDLDFVVCSDTSAPRYGCGTASAIPQVGGAMALGSVGAFHNTAAGGAMIGTGGESSLITIAPFATAGSVVYGTDATNFATILGNNCQCRYTSTSVAHFKSTHSVFTIGKSLTSGYAFDQAGGTFIGPTTCTQAHQDAAQGAGTGFGGVVCDPASGCIFAAL